MSTLQATNIKSAASASNNIVLDSAGNATFAGTAAMASSFLRNRLINGGMQIAQRGTSGTSGYLIDRWLASDTTAQSQSSDAPSGFLNSLEFTTSTAQFPRIAQRIERLNSYDLAGRTVTLSFWAKSVSGSANLYIEIVRANAADNFSSVTNEATIVVSSSPSTSWTFYSVTTTLSASATNGIEVLIIRNNASASSTRVTGVQLEVGSVATPFERRQFGHELELCQRYFYKSFDQGQVPGVVGMISCRGVVSSSSFRTSHSFKHAVTMRATPTIVLYNPTTGAAGSARIEDGNLNGSATPFIIGQEVLSGIDVGSASAGNAVLVAYTASAEL